MTTMSSAGVRPSLVRMTRAFATALLPIAVAAVGAVGVGGIAAPARADTVFSHNFECPSFSAGPLAGQQGWVNGGTVQSAIVGPMGGAQSVRVAASQDAQHFASIPTAGQTIVVTFDFYRTGSNANQWGFPTFGDTGFIAQIAGVNGILVLGNTNSTTAPVALTDQVWHHVVLTMNFVTNTMNATLDGNSMGTIAINTSPLPTHVTQQSAISAPAMDLYFDNFSTVTSNPVNDACADATPVSLGSTPFSTVGATTVGPTHASCTVSGYDGIDADIWYTFAAPAAGPVTVSTCGATYDTKIAAYSGTCATLAATLLDCNDDTTGCAGGGDPNLGSRITFNAAAGQTYLIRVGGFLTWSGSGTLVISQVSTGACCNRWTGNCTVRSQADCLVQGLRFDGFGAACSAATCKNCPADFNGSGIVNVTDIFAYLSAWFAGCP